MTVSELRYHQRRVLPGLTGLLLLYFASRMFDLLKLPIFIDESTHITRAITFAETGQFLGLNQAGKYLFIWIMSSAVFFDSHLLWTGRLIVVGFGVFGLIGCYLLGRRMFGQRTGLLAAFLYLIVPYTFFYDRMALADNLLTALAIYVLFFSLRLIQKPNLKDTLALGLVLGLANMAKLNGFIFYILPIIVLVVQFPHSIRNRSWRWLALSFGLAALGLLPLFLNWEYDFEDQANKLEQVGAQLWQIWLINGTQGWLYLVRYLSPLIFGVACLGAVLAITQRQRNLWLLWATAGSLIASVILSAQPDLWYPRYLLPAIPFLLLIVAYTITWGTNQVKNILTGRANRWRPFLAPALMIIIILPALRFNYWLVADPSQAPLVEIDRWQYINGWPSGAGLPETAEFLTNQLTTSEEIVIAYDYYANRVLRFGLPIYLHHLNHRIIFLRVDFAEEQSQPRLIQGLSELQHVPIFVVLDNPAKGQLNSDFEESSYTQHLQRFYKPNRQSAIDIYQASFQLNQATNTK